MNHISVVDAIKFGFDKAAKKFFFFIGTFVVAGFVWIGCLLLSGLAAAPFFIPAKKIIKQIIVLFKMPSVGMEFKRALMVVMMQLSELAEKSPYILVLAIVGILVFIALVWFFSIMISLGMVKIFMDVHDKGHSSLSNLFVRPIYVFRGFVVSILYFFILSAPMMLVGLAYYVGIGLWLIVLLAIPAVVFEVYILLKLFYSNYFVIDKGLGAVASIKSSWRLRGAASKLLLFWMLLVVFVLAATVPAYLLGFLNTNMPHAIWTILLVVYNLATRYFLSIVIFMGYIYLYRRLSSR